MKKIVFFFYLLLINFSKLVCEEKSDDIHPLHTPLIYHSVNVITGQYCEVQTDLTTSGPLNFKLRRSYQGQQGGLWEFNAPNLIAINDYSPPEEKYSHQKISYEYDPQKRLKSLKIGDFVQLEILRNSTHTQECKVISQDSLETSYHFSQPNPTTAEWLLNEVHSSQNPSIKYEYVRHSHLRAFQIKKRILPDGRYLMNEYYSLGDNPVGDEVISIGPSLRDHRLGRIKMQLEPLGKDGSPVIARRYIYGTQFTEVYDALGHKTIYRYTPHQRLLAIENYETTSGEYRLYRKEKFFWDEKSIPGYPLLISRSMENGQGEVHICRTFKYDQQGNVLKETVWGNLTGQCLSPLILDEFGYPQRNGIESYSTSYIYTKEAPFLLLSKKEDNGKRTTYGYKVNSSLIEKKLVFDHQRIVQREFYYYDHHNHLIQSIKDNGSSDDIFQLQDVTERHIVRRHLKYSKPAYGSPHQVLYLVWDKENGREITVKAVTYEYDSHGNVVEEKTWDGHHKLLQSLTLAYDSKNRLIQKLDQFNNLWSWTYDENNNIIASESPSERKNYQFDYANRLIKNETTLETKESFTEHLSYDYLGNLIGSVDPLGCETQHFYDSFCRKIQTIHPLIINEKEQLFQPIEYFEYDIFNNLIKKTDPYGYVTHYQYNARSKPTKISYPDGTCEIFIYDLEGNLVQETNKLLHTTSYKRDSSGQIIESVTKDSEGHLIQSQQLTYQNNRITRSRDHLGNETIYQYNFLGQVIEVQKKIGKEIHIQKHTYDVQGNLLQTEYFPEKDKLLFKTLFERDEKNQLLATLVFNSQGKLIKKTTHQKPSLIAPKVEIRLNTHQLPVKCLSQVDEEGNLTETFYDVLGHLERMVIKNSWGKVVLDRNYRHNFYGNKTKEFDQNVTHLWFYGPHQKLTEKIQNWKTPDQKITQYLYNFLGQRDTVIKPDGTLLSYIYYPNGLLKSFYSSDRTVDYTYTYNPAGQITSIYNAVDRTTTYRHYDTSCHLVEEVLANGLSLKSTYNQAGHRLSLTCPDQSKINYSYQDGQLQSLKRFNAEGNCLYEHQYTLFDLQGNVLESQGLFSSSWTYDTFNQCSSIQTPYWDCQITREKGKIQQIHTSEGASFWEYDSLGQISSENGEIVDYDSLGNCLQSGYSYQNYQLQSTPENSFRYDLNGNLIEKIGCQGSIKFSYDALNRLIQINSEELSINYQYDGFHRKIAKTLLNIEGQQTLKYLYDGFNEIGCVKEGQLTEFRMLGKGKGAEIEAGVLFELKSRLVVPIYDFRGSIKCLIDLDTQEVIESYHYDRNGRVTIFSNGQIVSESTVGNPWLFSSKRLENLGLYDFGKRFYDPMLGRWMTPDPLGDFDGPNPYLFVHNDPINHMDLYGLFTAKHDLSHVTAGAKNFFWELNDFIKGNFSFEDQVSEQIEKASEELFGKTFLVLLGVYHDPIEAGIYGNGEMSDKVRITMINGMLNVRLDCQTSAAMISDSHGHANVHFVFHPTQGWGKDLLQILAIKLFGYVSPQARLLARTWKTMIDEMGGVDGGGVIYHYAHSLGGADSYLAKDLLSPAEQKMIRVMTFGTAKIIPEGGFQSVVNYVSRRDGIPGIADPINYLKALRHEIDNVVFLGSWIGIPFIDHALNTDTYAMMLEGLGRQFIHAWGYQ